MPEVTAARRGTRLPLLVLLAGLAAIPALPPPTAAAQDTGAENDAEARRRFRLAQAHYDNGDFERAAEGFEEAYRLSRRPQLLYNTYVAYRDAQMLPNAVDALRRYLEAVPNAPDGDQLRARLERMEEALEARGSSATVETDETDERGIDSGAMGEEQPDETPEGADTADDDTGTGGGDEGPAEDGTDEGTPSDATVGGSISDDDTSGGGLPIPAIVVGGAGVALIVGGVITGVMASSAQSDLEDGCPSRTACDPELEDTLDRGKTLALLTDVLLFGGIAAVGTGVALWFLMGDASTETGPGDTVASVGCMPGGCAGSVKVSF